MTVHARVMERARVSAVRLGFFGFAVAILAGASRLSAGDGELVFDTGLLELQLSGGPFPLPVASDPGNILGDSIDGYGFVDSLVTVTLSSQRPAAPGPASLGAACAFREGPAALGGGVGNGGRTCGEIGAIDPGAFDGAPFFVTSFFDVFFDITVTDVDSRPGRDFAGAPNGASIVLTDNGPASMSAFYRVFFDADAPSFGLVPPHESAPYIGHFLIEIPLGGDINGNGENDKVKFTLATLSVREANRAFIGLPDGTVLVTFDSAGFLEGAVVDESSGLSFSIGAQLRNGLPDPASFGGPTTARSVLAGIDGCGPTGARFLRGDANGDGSVDGTTADIIFLAQFLFLGGPPPPCRAAADANGDGDVPGTTADIIFLAQFLFLGGPEPPPPGARSCGAGTVADVSLGCANPPECPE